tara:strand:+ start:106 stop:453 length:348 start_codon:yes stop_codon:yes gene_type:complete
VNKGERIEVTDLQKDMNDLKSQVNRMWKHFSGLELKITETNTKVDKLTDLLQDDDKSTNTGILTRINELEKSVGQLVSISERLDAYAKSAKKWFWWAMTFVAGVFIAIVKAAFYS